MKGTIADPAVFKGMFPDIVNAFTKNGGRIKFDLTGLDPALKGVTQWELQQILASKTLTSKTDFFLNGKQLRGAKLEAALEPWRANGTTSKAP